MIAVDPSSISNEALTVDWLEAGPWITPWADNTVFRLRLGARQQKKGEFPISSSMEEQFGNSPNFLWIGQETRALYEDSASSHPKRFLQGLFGIKNVE